MQIKTQQPFKRIDIVPNHTLIPLACQDYTTFTDWNSTNWRVHVDLSVSVPLPRGLLGVFCIKFIAVVVVQGSSRIRDLTMCD